MKTINIKGKEYVMVNERIKEFRDKYPTYSLESEIVLLNENEVVIKAIIKDEAGIVKATGLAQELKNASMINKTSYVENCETSAWGRALGNLGIGIDTSIASAEEVFNAIQQQQTKSKCSEELIKELKGLGGTLDIAATYFKCNIEDLEDKQLQLLIDLKKAKIQDSLINKDKDEVDV